MKSFTAAEVKYVKKIFPLSLIAIWVITVPACGGSAGRGIENNDRVTQAVIDASITAPVAAAPETPVGLSTTRRPLPAGMPTVETELNRMLAVLQSGGFSFLKDRAVEHYGEADFVRPGQLTYTVSFPSAETIFFNYAWCAATVDILNQNLDHISLDFVFNEQEIPNEYILTVNNTLDDGWACANGGMLLSNWSPGEYHLRVIASFEEQINDGSQDFDAGDYIMDYDISVQ